ncbi:pilus assembly protein TadG-related protein [Nocardioides marmorisolisilvae]|uniref:Putative Flp pilus-assembly TadG-like N-terminal domain-containing protein n=1 Tax=Nocardioides marmorisolisilvae TaxID=1542737 RepID=A0A3N0DW56_9ACTN|nr:pilus assembly protein TadG-related protein [Nocardioides marmorisolisilvae]RNL79838.1 hypothetical protein EFL95_12890 [Nocardioides marmorisolisilvae]
MTARLRARRRGEDGVVAIVVALITCFTLIPMAALAVDIGVQRVARRDAQAVADLVAMDLARQLDGRTVSQLSGTLQTLANKSAARQGATGFTVTPQLGTLGTYDPANPDAYFVATSASNAIPTAVKVTVAGSVKFSIQADKSGSVTRTAIAKSTAYVCFNVGSFAANLDSSKSALLNSLIGDALNVSALSYTGLANANVTLLGLATELGVGSVDGLLNLTNLSLNDLFLASATALQKSGGDTASVTLLNQLATANLGALPHIKLSDVLALQAGDNSALDTNVNLLDLVGTAAFVANGNNALDIPSLTVGVPNVASVTGTLKVIEKPREGCAFNQAVKTSQVDLQLHVTLANLNVLGLAATTTVDINASLASANATMTNAFCGTPEGVDVAVSSALSSLSVATNIDLKLLGLTIVRVSPTVGTTVPAGSQTVQFRHPPDAYGAAKSVGSNVIAPTLTTSDLSANAVVLGILPLGLNLGSVLGGVMSTIITPIVNPLITNLNNTLLTPLTSALGLKVGGADIYVNKPPVCNHPALAG